MPEAGLRVRKSLLDRLEALSRERQLAAGELLEEALAQYLDLEEHYEAMFAAYRREVDRAKSRRYRIHA